MYFIITFRKLKSYCGWVSKHLPNLCSFEFDYKQGNPDHMIKCSEKTCPILSKCKRTKLLAHYHLPAK